MYTILPEVCYVLIKITTAKNKGGEGMDFLTGFAYWGIILLAIINAIIVLMLMKVDIGDK